MSFENERERLLAAAVEVVLTSGIHVSSREMALAMGTSHRVLDYYFGGRASLIDSVLVRLSEMLQAGLPPLPADLSPAAALREFVAAMAASSRPGSSAVWLEVLTGAARGEPQFVAAAARIVEPWRSWLSSTLALDDVAADAVLAAVEGAGIISIIRGPAAGDAALRRLIDVATPAGGSA